MTLKMFAMVWALTGLAVTLTLIAAARRVGREKTAARLVVVGLFMLTFEEPLLTFFWGLVDPRADRDGMATLVTAPARAHILDTTIFATALFVLLGWIALTAFRRGERWASQVLLAGWTVVTATIIVTMLAVYSRGVPLPTAGGMADGAGYGWEQLAVGLLAWASGLWLWRSARLTAVNRAPGQA